MFRVGCYPPRSNVYDVQCDHIDEARKKASELAETWPTVAIWADSGHIVSVFTEQGEFRYEANHQK